MLSYKSGVVTWVYVTPRVELIDYCANAWSKDRSRTDMTVLTTGVLESTLVGVQNSHVVSWPLVKRVERTRLS